MALLTFAVVLLAASTAIAQDEACYFRDGSPATGYTSCPGPNGTRTAACCASNGWPHTDPCLSNGFCFSSDIGAIYRGACTDSNWGTTQCPQECRNVNRVGTAWLSVCADLSLCCSTLDDDNLNDCCENGTANGRNDKFAWSDATFTGNVNASTLYSVYDSRHAISGAASNSSGNSTSSDSNSGNSTLITQSEDNKVSQSAVIGVGVGLGIPLLIFMVSSMWLFFALRRERARRRDTPGDINGPVMSGSASIMKEGSPSPFQAPPYDPTGRPISAQEPYPTNNGYAYNTSMETSPKLAVPGMQRPVELYGDREMVEAPEDELRGAR